MFPPSLISPNSILKVIAAFLFFPVSHALAENNFVRAHDYRFELDGHAYRLVGFNIRDLTNYGAWDPAGASRTDDIDANLQAAAAAGARVIRCFVSLNNST